MNPHIFIAKVLIPQADGSIYTGHGGSFMIENGHLFHLSAAHDNQLLNLLPEGPVTADTWLKIQSPPPGLLIAHRDEIGNGNRLDFVPEASLTQPLSQNLDPEPTTAPVQTKPSIWMYHRNGMDRPHLLECYQGKFLLDGHPLTSQEVARILQNVENRLATLRYKTHVTKSEVDALEKFFQGLYKSDELDPQGALEYLDSLKSTDPKHQAAVKALRQHVFRDVLMGDANWGNRYAFEQFQKKNKPGVYGSMDLNDLREHNTNFGHSGGDDAIRAWGTAGRQAADEAAPGKIKLFHISGDEGAFHAETPEDAYKFLSAFRSKVQAIPPVGGTHNISFSAGIGHDYQTADKALYNAKANKFLPTGERAHQPGKTPNFFHSLLPGSEGDVPQDNHVEPIKQPEDPKAA